MRISSTNNRWRTWIILDTSIPAKRPLYLPRFKAKLNPSITRIKRSDDRGQPCLSPLLLRNNSDGSPLTRTTKVADIMRPIIQLVMGNPNPHWRRTSLMKSQFTQSHAFFRSILSISACSSFSLIPWRHSCAVPIASIICLPFKKPNCSSEMVWERICLSLVAIILEINVGKYLTNNECLSLMASTTVILALVQ